MLIRKNWIVATFLLSTFFTALAMGSQGDEGGISPFAGDFGNAVWTLLIFVLVVVVLAKFAWGPILQNLQSREKFIRESLESARRDREDAEARLQEYEQRLQKARYEASALVDEGRRDANVVKQRIEDGARQSAETTLDRAKREIGIARDTALRELYEQSAQLAMTMAGEVLKRQLSAEDHHQLVQEALAELRKKPGSTN